MNNITNRYKNHIVHGTDKDVLICILEEFNTGEFDPNDSDDLHLLQDAIIGLSNVIPEEEEDETLREIMKSLVRVYVYFDARYKPIDN